MNGRGLLMLASGFTLWAVAFIVLYAMLSIGCRFGWDETRLPGGVSLQRAQLIAIFLVFLAGGMWLAVKLKVRSRTSFIAHASYVAALAALGAIFFSFIGVLSLSTCI